MLAQEVWHERGRPFGRRMLAFRDLSTTCALKHTDGELYLAIADRKV